MAEFRADGLEPSAIPGLIRDFREACVRELGHALETIVTLRLKRDGGQWPDALASEREKVWLAMGLEGESLPCDWLDLEVEEYPRLSGAMHALLGTGRIKVLLSHHNCRGTHAPSALRKLLGTMASHRTTGLKVAVTCRTPEELSEWLDFTRELARCTAHGCALSMGEAARASRVLGPLLGCPLTYGYLTGDPVAPGQLSVRELRDFLSGPEAPDAESVGSLANPVLVAWAEERLRRNALAI